MNNLFYIPLIIAWLILLFLILSESAKSKTKKISNKRLFKGELYNELNNFSYEAPFKWFIPEVEVKKKGKIIKDLKAEKKINELKSLISKANLGDKFNYKSFTVLKLIVFFLCAVGYVVFSILLDNSNVVMNILFNISYDAQKATEQVGGFNDSKIALVIILLIISLIPQMYLKMRAKRNEKKFLKDIPIVQLFITLMLRSNMSVNQILYVLSRTNTIYKETFGKAYRMFVRDNKSGLDFLRSSFKETKFEETVMILFQSKDYSKEEILHSLDNNMEDTVEFLNNMKQSADISKIVYSQASMIIPFAGTILLALAPIAIYGLTSLTQYT
ncbi:hypothetical protein BFS06_12445 [Clostridium perfringens]|uniref:hypothetical protein n=1 Tax=Clostridium perfringens TaxID=1502 RepID=UPI00103CB79B|nr:hypothetical protein [Clostridium perfringens]TBX15011.1 hypothetical protein BFS06_12445 [Clostridium perfringens]